MSACRIVEVIYDKKRKRESRKDRKRKGNNSGERKNKSRKYRKNEKKGNSRSFTKTKRELSPILGIEAYRAIIERCTYNSINKPIVAIGGIVENDFKLLADTGLYGVAVSSMINKSKNIIETFNNASNFKKYFEL